MNGRWFLVDPEGHLMFHNGIVSFSHQANDGFSPYNSATEWGDAVIPYLHDLGIYSGGGWTIKGKAGQSEHEINYMLSAFFLLEFWVELGNPEPSNEKGIGPVNPVLHPSWFDFVDRHAQEIVAPYNNDPRFVGVFTGNELLWDYDILKVCLEQSDYNYDYAVEWVQNLRGDSGSVTAENVTEEETSAFFKHYLERYYQPISQALKRHMPNHLNYGSRVYQTELMGDPDFLEVYSQNVDVMTFNRFSYWSEPTALMDKITEYTNKPWLISAFNIKGDEFDYFDNVEGAGQIAYSQTDRGYYFQNSALSWLQHGSALGWHWFRYRDEDHTDPTKFVSQKGLFDLWHRPYETFGKLIAQVNNQAIYLAEYFDGTSYLGMGEQTLIADFRSNVMTVNVGEFMQFTDESTGHPTSWMWTFESTVNSVSNKQNPVKRFNNPGEVTVTLTVGNANGKDTVTKTAVINVVDPEQNQAPTIEFFKLFNDQAFTEQDNVYIRTLYDDIDGQVMSVEFFANDQSIKLDTSEPFAYWNWVPPGLGSYKLHMIATDNEGAQTKSETITISVFSSDVYAEFSSDVFDIDECESVQFTNLSSNSTSKWHWTFEGGSPDVTTDKHPSVTYTKSGVYPVTLTVESQTLEKGDTEHKSGYIVVRENALKTCSQ